MEVKKIELPIIIGGKTYYPKDVEETYELSYSTGVIFVIPKINKELINRLSESNRFSIHDLQTQDIISFFARIGRFWLPSNSSHNLYQNAVEYLSLVNGYDPKMAHREFNIIGATCGLSAGLYDLIDAELDNRFYLEEWIPRGDAIVHAQPWGNALHIMVGNVPITSVMTIIRGILSKNQTIAKLPRRDPITALFFALSFIELAPDHPITKSLNIFYWAGGDSIEQEILPLGDIICVWGGGSAVKNIKQNAEPGVEIIEFGPKRSFALIGKEVVNCKKTALKLAHDISIYNQEACFSPQIAFVEGDYKAFITNLKMALDKYSAFFPKGIVIEDIHAHVNRTRLEQMYSGREVIASKGTEWTIFLINDPSEINEHPLSRVIFVIPVKDISECIKYIDKSVQTITISPWSRNEEIREIATLKGAAKITETSLVEVQRVGTTHDNLYPLQRLVRWVCVERGCDYWGKFIEQGPVDTTLYLMMNESQKQEIDI